MNYDALSYVLELKSIDLNCLLYSLSLNPDHTPQLDSFIKRIEDISDTLKSLSNEVKQYSNEVQK